MALLFSSIFSSKDKVKLVEAITESEKKTSGEIRLFMEAKCEKDALERAIEVFQELKMIETEARNGILIYVAFESRKIAIYGDTAIHQLLGLGYWDDTIKELIQKFKKKRYTSGLIECIHDLGEKLAKYFPITANDRNELPNDIVFGDDMLD
jgi:uncharacterized membrane protein